MQRYYLQNPTYEKKEKLYLAAPTLVTKADSVSGIVDAFVSVMGNVDLMDDIIHAGAFAKTIQENGTDFRVLDNHNFFSILDALGTVLAIEERPRKDLPKQVQDNFPDATGGLFTSTQFMLDDDRSRGAFNRLKSGAINQFSIGFEIMKQDFSEENFGTEDEPLIKHIRNIREIKLYEYSPVIFAANTATAVAGVKNFVPITVDNLKRAETKHACKTCVFFGKFSLDVGYCKKHEGTTKHNTICDEYETDGTVKRTYADEFESHLTDNLSDLFKEWQADIDLLDAIPTMVKSMATLLPDVAHSQEYKPQDESDSESSSTSENEAATNETLTKEQRLVLMREIKQRQINANKQHYGV